MRGNSFTVDGWPVSMVKPSFELVGWTRAGGDGGFVDAMLPHVSLFFVFLVAKNQTILLNTGSLFCGPQFEDWTIRPSTQARPAEINTAKTDNQKPKLRQKFGPNIPVRPYPSSTFWGVLILCSAQ